MAQPQDDLATVERRRIDGHLAEQDRIGVVLEIDGPELNRQVAIRRAPDREFHDIIAGIRREIPVREADSIAFVRLIRRERHETALDIEGRADAQTGAVGAERIVSVGLQRREV